VAGLAWDIVFPLNKKIWTSSYVVYTSGLAVLTIMVMIWLIEFRGLRKLLSRKSGRVEKNDAPAKTALSRFFEVFGKNPLFIFVLSGFLPRALALIRIPNGLNNTGEIRYTTPFGWFYQYVCKPVFTQPEAGSLLYAVLMLVFY